MQNAHDAHGTDQSAVAVLPTAPADLAAFYAGRGLPVFPLHPATRTPIEARPEDAPESEKWGHHRATTDPEQVAAWWNRWPRAAIGLPTSAFWVLDVDAKDPAPNRLATAGRSLARVANGETIAGLIAQCSLVTETPGGGLHLYWPAVPGVSIRTAAGDVGAGLDTRGHTARHNATGYIPAPQTVTARGTYRIVHGSIDALVSGRLAPAPRRLLWLAHLSRAERDAINRAAAWLAPMIEKQRPETWRHEYENLMRIDAEKAAAKAKVRYVMPTDDAPAMRRQALADLNEVTAEFAAMTEGRTNAAHEFGVRLGKYMAHGILNFSEIEAAFASAWRANGSEAKRGWPYGKRQLTRGLEFTKNADLPRLARRFRD